MRMVKRLRGRLRGRLLEGGGEVGCRVAMVSAPESVHQCLLTDNVSISTSLPDNELVASNRPSSQLVKASSRPHSPQPTKLPSYCSSNPSSPTTLALPFPFPFTSLLNCELNISSTPLPAESCNAVLMKARIVLRVTSFAWAPNRPPWVLTPLSFPKPTVRRSPSIMVESAAGHDDVMCVGICSRNRWTRRAASRRISGKMCDRAEEVCSCRSGRWGVKMD